MKIEFIYCLRCLLLLSAYSVEGASNKVEFFFLTLSILILFHLEGINYTTIAEKRRLFEYLYSYFAGEL